MKLCEICFRRKLFVKQRTFTPKVLNVPITSQVKMCRVCFKNVKKYNFQVEEKKDGR